MSAIPRPKGVMIGCSVLQAEVESLCEVHWPDHKLIFLPSMMHMHPQQLASSLESVLDAELKQGYGVVLIYGDCCAQMTALEALPGVVRTRGNNCCDLLLGRGEYRRLSHEGAFFLIPEWARRWREIFSKELGLNRVNATSFMRDMHRRLVYLIPGSCRCRKRNCGSAPNTADFLTRRGRYHSNFSGPPSRRRCSDLKHWSST